MRSPGSLDERAADGPDTSDGPGGPSEPDGPDAADAPPTVVAAPWWFEQALVVVCATVVAWGGAGLFLAYRAEYTLGRAAVLGSVGTLLGVAFAAMRRPPDRRRGSSGPALAMVVGAAAVGVWNAVDAGHHVVADRDQGVYLLTGKWIAAHGNLVVPAGAGWPDIPQLALNSGGTYPGAGRTVQFQFAHFLPSLLAEAQGIGGDGLMFRTNAILGAASLLVLFAVGCRVCKRPWLVVAAVLGLAVSIPEINSVRDTFSEPSTQFVLWAGIWLLIVAMEARRGRRHLGVAVLGGAALGATVMTRIDGVAYLIFLPLLAACGWLTREGKDRRELLATYAAILIGALPAVALGTLDVQRRAGGYYHDLHGDVMSLYKVCAAMTVVSVLLVIVWPRANRIRDWILARRARFASLAAWGAAGVMVLAWSVRPAIQKVHLAHGPKAAPYISLNSNLQRREGLVVDGLRTYGERSVVWLSWYLGPVAVAFAIVGIGFLAARMIRHPSAAVVVPLLVAGSLSAEYLWNPHVNGDQPWVMRRMIPSVLPLCAVVAAVGLSQLCDAAQVARVTFNLGAVAAVGALALVAFPLGRTFPVRDLSTDRNISAAVEAVCHAVGPRAAIVTRPSIGAKYAQTFRDFCDVPVATLEGPVHAATVHGLAAGWKAQGRTLWVVGGARGDVLADLPRSRPKLLASVVANREVELTLTRPPGRYASKALNFWGVPA